MSDVPVGYAQRVNVIQAAVAIVVVICVTVAGGLGIVSGDALIAIYSAIGGAVLGAGAVAAGANGVAQKVQESTESVEHQQDKQTALLEVIADRVRKGQM